MPLNEDLRCQMRDTGNAQDGDPPGIARPTSTISAGTETSRKPRDSGGTYAS